MDYTTFFTHIPQEHLLVKEKLSNHTSFKIGGEADLFISPTDIKELQSVLQIIKDNHIRFMMIGGGNNILFSDKGFRGIIVTTKQLTNLSISKNIVTSDCGVNLKDLTSFCLEHNHSGLEFACGIPGTVGGAIFMNAGAYGGEMKDVVQEVTYLDNNYQIQKNNIEQHNFAYRKSIYQQESFIVLSTTFKLKQENHHNIKSIMADLQCKRESKQPLDLPSAGSIFRRPEGHYTGKLIDDSNLRGYQIGGAQVSTKHAGFIVNTGNATAKDVTDLIEHIQTTVFKNYQVELVTEVRIIPEI